MAANPHTAEQRVEIIEKVLENIREGMPEYAASKQAGISYPTWYNWVRDTPGLEVRKSDAKLFRIPLWEDGLHKAALKGSVTACITLLQRYDRSWRESAKDLSGTAAMEKLAGATAAALIASMSSEKRAKVIRIISSMKQIGAPIENGRSES